MVREEPKRCRKCGKEFNTRITFHACDHTEYDNAASDAIDAVRDKCKACHNGLVRGATKMVPCPHCIPSMDAIRKATGGGNDHLSAYQDGKRHGRMLGVNDAIAAVEKMPEYDISTLRDVLVEAICDIREKTGVKE